MGGVVFKFGWVGVWRAVKVCVWGVCGGWCVLVSQVARESVGERESEYMGCGWVSLFNPQKSPQG